MTEKKMPQCAHGMPYDSVCRECDALGWRGGRRWMRSRSGRLLRKSTAPDQKTLTKFGCLVTPRNGTGS